MEGNLLSSSGQLRSRSGLVQVWFSKELKFNSFELDSEVGRLVVYYIDSVINLELSDRVVRGAGGGGDGFVGQLVLGVGGQSQSRNCQVRV